MAFPQHNPLKRKKKVLFENGDFYAHALDTTIFQFACCIRNVSFTSQLCILAATYEWTYCLTQ